MNGKIQQSSVLILISVLVLVVAVEAVSTKQIDAVRRKALLDKEVLEDADFEVIDSFWEEALAELLLAEDLSEIVRIRNLIFERSGNEEPDQYSVGFIASAKKHLEAAFGRINNWPSDQRKAWVERNLIILTAQLANAELLDFGMRMIGHENTTIRYWAVKSLTNSGIVRHLNSPDFSDTELAVRIIGQLETTAKKETHPEIISLIATFAGQVNEPLAKELLTKIVDLRTQAYANRTVKYELMDAKLLRLLGNEILSQESRQTKGELGRKFAQLYSYVMQRYILGEGMLNDSSKHQLASVLVEVEQSVLGRLLGRPQSIIKKAVEKILIKQMVEQKDYSALEREHDSLLGSAAGKGALPVALNFDYGKNADGTAITGPKKLGPPPEEQVEGEADEFEGETSEADAEVAETGG